MTVFSFHTVGNYLVELINACKLFSHANIFKFPNSKKRQYQQKPVQFKFKQYFIEKNKQRKPICLENSTMLIISSVRNCNHVFAEHYVLFIEPTGNRATTQSYQRSTVRVEQQSNSLASYDLVIDTVVTTGREGQ